MSRWIALAQHELGVGDAQILVEFGAARGSGRNDPAKGSAAHSRRDRLVWLLARMRATQTTDGRGMPILRQHHVREPLGQPVDQRHDLVPARDRQPPAGTEVVLDVDDDEDIAVADRRSSRVISAFRPARPDDGRLRRELAPAPRQPARGMIAPGSSLRNGSGRRCSSRAARARISVSVGDGAMRFPLLITCG